MDPASGKPCRDLARRIRERCRDLKDSPRLSWRDDSLYRFSSSVNVRIGMSISRAARVLTPYHRHSHHTRR
jgi:hypothetical protein